MKLQQPKARLIRLIEDLRVARDLGNDDRAEDIIRQIFLLVGLNP